MTVHACMNKQRAHGAQFLVKTKGENTHEKSIYHAYADGHMSLVVKKIFLEQKKGSFPLFRFHIKKSHEKYFVTAPNKVAHTSK